MSSASYAGTGLLLRLALRRDRILVAVGTLLLVGVCYASAAATGSLYPTPRARVAAAEGINATPAVVGLYGPILDVHSPGELAMTKLTVLYAVFVAVLVAVVVRRHTRGDEEAGRTELLGGTAVGPDAPLTAAVAEGAVVSLAVGLLAALADVGGGLPVVGSVLFGASWAGVGLVGTAVTAVACQLSASARTCAGIVAGALGAMFVLRAAGDLSSPWLSWISPLGWGTRLRAWSEPRPWVLLLYAGTTALLLLAAQRLRARRDLGAGLLAPRPGPRHGSPRLADAITLTWRLHRPTLVTWTVATGLMGLVMGAIAPGVGTLLDSTSARQLMQRLGGIGAVQQTLVAAELSVAAVVLTFFALAVVSRGGGDEQAGRAEQVLAGATSRSRAFLATTTVALVGVTWLLLVVGVATAIGFGVTAGHAGSRAVVVGAALAQAPAVWLVAALAVAAYSLRSRWAVAGWGLLAVFVTLGQVGELLRLPAWAIGLSPYTHVARMPVEPFAVEPSLVMSLLALGVLGLGWAAYRSRDVPG